MKAQNSQSSQYLQYLIERFDRVSNMRGINSEVVSAAKLARKTAVRVVC